LLLFPPYVVNIFWRPDGSVLPLKEASRGGW